MTGRAFFFYETGGEMLRSICVIPSAFMLAMQPLQHWVKRFRDFTRRSPSEIVLPAIGFTGPNYDSSIHACPGFLQPSYSLRQWISEARETVGESGFVWVLINNELGFMKNQALWLKNQYFDDLPQGCANNPVVQDVVHDYMHEICELGGIDGIALDFTDAYPNTGAEGYEGLLAHCFCDFCCRDLAEYGFKEAPRTFVGKAGLLRFVLKIDENARGAAQIDAPQSWIDQRDVNSLIAFSVARRFVAGNDAELERDASRLLKYLDARCKVSAKAIRGLLGICKEKGVKSAVVLGSAAVDMSQMVTLAALDRFQAAGEYWLPNAPDKSALPGTWQAVQFLSPRSTYYANKFFETVEQAEETAVSFGAQRFLQILMSQSKPLRGNKLGSGAAYVTDKLPQYSGFAGVPLGGDDHLAIVSRLSTDVTGAVLPKPLLDAFRIGNPDGVAANMGLNSDL